MAMIEAFNINERERIFVIGLYYMGKVKHLYKMSKVKIALKKNTAPCEQFKTYFGAYNDIRAFLFVRLNVELRK